MSSDSIRQLLISAKLIKYHEGVIGLDDIQGVNNITELSRDDSTHIERSIALVETDTEQAIYVIIPGSNDREDWIANFKFRFRDMIYKVARDVVAQAQTFMDLPQAYSDIGLTIPHAQVEGSERWSDQRVHSGFMQAYYRVQESSLADLKQALDDYPDASIYGTAHSLGTAILRFLFLDSQFKGLFGENRVPHLHTFGAPRMGNSAFVKSLIGRIPNITRVVHNNDLVPRLPLPLIGYRHGTDEFHIGTRRTFRWYYRDDIRDHYMEAYITKLNQLQD